MVYPLHEGRGEYELPLRHPFYERREFDVVLYVLSAVAILVGVLVLVF